MSIEVDLLEKLFDKIINSEVIKQYFKRKAFLNYDVTFLKNQYKKELQIGNYIPYLEVVNWIPESISDQKRKKIIIKLDEQQFILDASDEALPLFQANALQEFIRLGKTTYEHNEDVIRISDIHVKDHETTLLVQKCKYHDQVKSNLVLDWKSSHALQESSGIDSLRSLINAKYQPYKLPPLNTNLLANSLGVSIIILYREGKNLIPYLPRRIGTEIKDLLKKTGRTPKNVAVHEGGFSTSASGAAQWNSGDNFYDFIMSDMLSEIDEEIGLYESDFEIIEPLALVREFLRGGKPQIFFGAITNLCKEDLNQRRSKAIAKTLKLNFVPEIHDEILDISSIEELFDDIELKGLNLEAIANLSYMPMFVEAYEAGFYKKA